MGVKVIRIYQLDSIINARLELVGSFFEVEVPAGPVAGGYQNKRLSFEQLAELLGGSTSPNHRNSLLKAYRYLTRAEIAANGNYGEAFEDLVYATCCIQTQIKVEKYQPDPAKPLVLNQVLVAVWDSTAYNRPERYVHVDGSFRDGDTTPAKFVPAESQEAQYGYVRRDTSPASIADWRIGELSIWTINGADQFATAKQAGGPFPAFTGVEDAYWKPVATPTQPAPSLLGTDNRWTGTNLYEQGILLSALGGAPDLGLQRSSAGVLEINTGVAGSPATLSTMDTVFQAAPAALNSGGKMALALAPYLGSGNTVTSSNLALGGSGHKVTGSNSLVGASVATTNSSSLVAGFGLIGSTLTGLQPGVATRALHLKNGTDASSFVSLSIGGAGGLVTTTNPAGSVPIVIRFRGNYTPNIAIDFGDTFNYQREIYTALTAIADPSTNKKFESVTWLSWNINGGGGGGTGVTAEQLEAVRSTVKQSPPITANYTLQLSDAGNLIQVTGAYVITVPTNANVAFPTGTVIELLAMGAGPAMPSVAAAAGVSVVAAVGNVAAGQYQSLRLVKLDTDTWHLAGGVA